jgi:glycerol-3-phosphate cytidylyltransferase
MEDTSKQKRTVQRAILTYGTYDLCHIGHIRLLKRAKALGDYLVVGLSTDNFNTLKGKMTVIPYNQRKEILESIRYVDEVIPEDNWEQKADDIKKYNAQMVMGDDWKGKFDEFNCIYLPRTKGISTTQIKEILHQSE